MPDSRSVGNPTPRVEGEEKTSGRAVYAADMVLPGMLWVKVLRSPIAHGRIKNIDATGALALPGVHAVVTGQDVSGCRIGKKIEDMPILAEGVVRFVGEKVAAVAAENPEIAEEALERIRVDYEELEPILDPLEAMEPSAPLVHPDVTGYRGLLHEMEKPSNVFVHLTWKKGDAEAGIRHADRVIENTFTTPRVHQGYVEPHACVARVHPDGRGDIWASTKSPFNMRDHVGKALKISPAQLVAHPCTIGGDFGGKGDHNDVALCYVLSQKCGRPVKFVMDYHDELTAGNPRHSSVVRIRTGVKSNGLILALHTEFVFDSGAYGAFRPQGFLVGAHSTSGPYTIPNVLIEERYVYTNKVPCGYMRAPGHTQGFFAMESQMDLVARELGMNPAEFREKNFMRDGDSAPTGEVIAHIRPEETLEKALLESSFDSPKAKNVGRGCAVAHWMSKGGESYARIRIDEDGGVTLSAAVMDVGPGAYTVMRQIVANELRIPLEAIRVEAVDTTKFQRDTGVRGSSSTRVHGGGAYEAAKRTREEILKVGATHMEAQVDDLILYRGGVTHGKLERRMTFADLVRANGSPIIAEGHYSDMTDGPEASVVAQVAEVEVDRETGAFRIRRLTTSHNVGAVLNPLTHQGQIEGGVVMGIGYAGMEEMVLDEGGKVATANLGDYKIPTAMDIPPLVTSVEEAQAGSGPYRSMSIGETAIMPTAAAIANAIHDAVGVRIQSLPITAEKIHRALNKR